MILMRKWFYWQLWKSMTVLYLQLKWFDSVNYILLWKIKPETSDEALKRLKQEAVKVCLVRTFLPSSRIDYLLVRSVSLQLWNCSKNARFGYSDINFIPKSLWAVANVFFRELRALMSVCVVRKALSWFRAVRYFLFISFYKEEGGMLKLLVATYMT